MGTAAPAKSAGQAVEYHQVGAPEVVRRTCATRCRTAASACVSPRAVAVAVVVAVVAAWAETRTRAGIYAVKFLVSRAEAWWLGNPKCPPRDVQHSVYHYPDRPSWDGDDAFWAHLPCGRSSYRVIVPPALLEAGSVAGLGEVPDGGSGDVCDDATIVTAFFDLGRSGWGGAYARKLEDYLSESKRVMLTLRNPQVWFTQDAFVGAILSERAKHGLENRTVVFAMDHACVPTAGLYNATAAALCAPGFLDFFWETWAPEQLYPWYSVSTQCQEAKLEGRPAGRYWVNRSARARGRHFPSRPSSCIDFPSTPATLCAAAGADVGQDALCGGSHRPLAGGGAVLHLAGRGCVTGHAPTARDAASSCAPAKRITQPGPSPLSRPVALQAATTRCAGRRTTHTRACARGTAPTPAGCAWRRPSRSRPPSRP
jgi:hypothetical protein